MAYRFVLGGVEVKCDTAQELKAALAGGRDVEEGPKTSQEQADAPFPRAKRPRKPVPGRKKGAAKSWAFAKWLVEKEQRGESAEDARSRLARMREADFDTYSKLENEFLSSLKGDKESKK